MDAETMTLEQIAEGLILMSMPAIWYRAKSESNPAGKPVLTFSREEFLEQAASAVRLAAMTMEVLAERIAGVWGCPGDDDLSCMNLELGDNPNRKVCMPSEVSRDCWKRWATREAERRMKEAK
jgi:hypothetical protein